MEQTWGNCLAMPHARRTCHCPRPTQPTFRAKNKIRIHTSHCHWQRGERAGRPWVPASQVEAAEQTLRRETSHVCCTRHPSQPPPINTTNKKTKFKSTITFGGGGRGQAVRGCKRQKWRQRNKRGDEQHRVRVTLVVRVALIVRHNPPDQHYKQKTKFEST